MKSFFIEKEKSKESKPAKKIKRNSNLELNNELEIANKRTEAVLSETDQIDLDRDLTEVCFYLKLLNALNIVLFMIILPF